MANYSVLKSAIEAVIKTNGNNEITGALLQQSLISMITSLGAHYDFVDVATPSTNPGTPDQNVMYFAAMAGTYTNFGGIVVNEGEFCALCWNGSWIKKTTGAATAEKVTALGQKVDGLALGKFYGFFLADTDIPAGDDPGYAYVGASSPFAIYVFNNGAWSDSGTVYGPAEGNGEDIDTNAQGKLQFANRPTTYGMGYKILRRDATFASQVGDSDTIYEIRYDFDLGGASVTIPAGCVLKFVGGSISGGTITFSDTGIDAQKVKIFENVTFGGACTSDFPVEWFGASAAAASNETAINKCIREVARLTNGGKVILSGRYVIASTILIYPKVSLVGDNRNSPYDTGGGDSTLRASLVASFSNTNSWVVRMTSPSEEADPSIIYPYDTLFQPPQTGSWNGRRHAGQEIGNFDITATSGYVFGGIRLYEFYGCNIHDIEIRRVLFGVCANYGWRNTFTNITTWPNFCGFYVGGFMTYNTFIGCTATKGSYGWTYPGSAPGIYGDSAKLFPSYTSVESVGILMEKYSADNTQCVFINFGFESIDACICAGENCVAIFDGIYIESISKTYAWFYSGKLSWKGVTAPGGLLSPDGTFEFGTQLAVMSIEATGRTRCFTPTVATNAAIGRYDVSIPAQRNVQTEYYDEHEVDESGNVLPETCVKCPTKNFIVSPQDLVFIRGYITKKENILRVGYQNGWNAIPLSEIAKRQEYNNITLVPISWTVEELTTFTRKKLRFLWRDTFQWKNTDYVQSSLRFNYQMQLDESEIEFDNVQVYFSAGASFAKFGILGSGNVLRLGKVGSDGTTASPAVELLGNKEITLDVFVPSAISLVNTVDRFVLNPTTFGYPFTINIYVAGIYARTFTNTRGDTAHRPTPAYAGFQYYDETIHKQIIHNGTTWVNIDGTAL